MRVTLHGQIQRRVSGMKVAHPGRPIRQPLNAEGPEHRLKGTNMTCLDPTADHPLFASDILTAVLADRPQRQMVIQQPAQQIAAIAIKVLLKLGVREPL